METKNSSLIVILVILSLLVVGLGGYIVYDKFIAKQTTSLILEEKTNFNALCGNANSCKKELGTVKLSNNELKLSAYIPDMNNIKTGYLSLGDKKVDLNWFAEDQKIDFLEIYNNEYLFVYTTGEGPVYEDSEKIYSYEIGIYDYNGNKITDATFAGYTCHSLKDFKIINGTLNYFNINRIGNEINLPQNTNHFDNLEQTGTVTIKDLLIYGHDKTAFSSNNYKCGMHENQP